MKDKMKLSKHTWYVSVTVDKKMRIKFGTLIFWTASTHEGDERQIDYEGYDISSGRLFPSAKKAKEHFEEFAKLNNITNYKFI